MTTISCVLNCSQKHELSSLNSTALTAHMMMAISCVLNCSHKHEPSSLNFTALTAHMMMAISCVLKCSQKHEPSSLNSTALIAHMMTTISPVSLTAHTSMNHHRPPYSFPSCLEYLHKCAPTVLRHRRYMYLLYIHKCLNCKHEH